VALVVVGTMFAEHRSSNEAPEAPSASASAFGVGLDAGREGSDERTEVFLVVSPIDAHAFDGEVDLGTMPITVSLEPGETRDIEVRREGFDPERVSVDGSKSKLIVKLSAIPGVEPQIPVPRAPDAGPFAIPRVIDLALDDPDTPGDEGDEGDLDDVNDNIEDLPDTDSENAPVPGPIRPLRPPQPAPPAVNEDAPRAPGAPPAPHVDDSPAPPASPEREPSPSPAPKSGAQEGVDKPGDQTPDPADPAVPNDSREQPEAPSGNSERDESLTP
jgi:hypothetical protein